MQSLPRERTRTIMVSRLMVSKGRIPDVTLNCIQYLRQRYPEVRVSVEVEKSGREGLQKLAEEADVIFYSKSWAMVRGPACDIIRGNWKSNRAVSTRATRTHKNVSGLSQPTRPTREIDCNLQKHSLSAN